MGWAHTRRMLAAMSALTVIAVAVPAEPAMAASRLLPLPNYGSLAVDDLHHRVFVSGGPTTNGIVVTNFSGKVKKRINGQSGATGMVLSADSQSLFVALAAGDAISVLDTKTFAQKARYEIGTQTCPTHLARTGAIIWFGYGCESDWTGKIGKLDTSTDPATVTLDQQGSALFQRAPLLTASPAEAGPLVAGQLSLSESSVQVFSVSGGALKAGANGDVVGAGLADLSLSPNGATLFSASGSRNYAEAFAPEDLSRRGAYSSGFRPNSVAASPDSRYLAIGRRASARHDVLVYRSGGSLPVKRVRLARKDVTATRGLAWSNDMKRLFVISQRADRATPALKVVTRPTKK